MKRFYKYFAVLVGLCLIVIFSSPVYAASDLEDGIKDLAQQISKSMTITGNKKIAVVEFSNLDGVITAFGQHLAEELITELFLVSPGQFEVVERRQLMKVMNELKLGSTGLLDSKSLKEVGKILAIDAIVTGSVTDLESNIKVNARMIGVESAKVFAVARTSIPKIGVVAKLMAKEVGGGQGNSVAGKSAVSGGVPKKEMSPAGDWKVKVKRDVGEGPLLKKFKITLQYVEKKGNTLIVGISFRNVTNRIERIALRYRYKQTTVLLDDNEGTEYNFRNIKGISDSSLDVNPGTKKLAHFTFPFPEGVAKARFVSVWGNCATCLKSHLSIPFTIPPKSEG